MVALIADSELYETFRVNRQDRAPLLDWVKSALQGNGCRIIRSSSPDRAPFRVSFELPSGQRHGIVAYAFLANQRETRNRPSDEHRFQIKYGPNDGRVHDLWQDEYGLYTTLLLGINLDRGFFVGADPVLHSPTRFFKSVEFKEHHVDKILAQGWHAWERERRPSEQRRADDLDAVSVLVGGTQASFLRYVTFERDALREDQGHRQLIAEKSVETKCGVKPRGSDVTEPMEPARLHKLTQELELSEEEVLDLIANAPRLKMAVRGWVAEEHLLRSLRAVPGVTSSQRLSGEGEPDIAVRFKGSRVIRIECKNVLRQCDKNGRARLDFQRTRASQSDPCSRYYSPNDFDVVAACLHSISERWEFQFADTRDLPPHQKCPRKITNLIRVDAAWPTRAEEIFHRVLQPWHRDTWWVGAP